jgi:hypothetical protein
MLGRLLGNCLKWIQHPRANIFTEMLGLARGQDRQPSVPTFCPQLCDLSRDLVSSRVMRNRWNDSKKSASLQVRAMSEAISNPTATARQRPRYSLAQQRRPGPLWSGATSVI